MCFCSLKVNAHNQIESIRQRTLYCTACTLHSLHDHLPRVGLVGVALLMFTFTQAADFPIPHLLAGDELAGCCADADCVRMVSHDHLHGCDPILQQLHLSQLGLTPIIKQNTTCMHCGHNTCTRINQSVTRAATRTQIQNLTNRRQPKPRA